MNEAIAYEHIKTVINSIPLIALIIKIEIEKKIVKYLTCEIQRVLQKST